MILIALLIGFGIALYFAVGLVVALLYGGADCLPQHLQGKKHTDRLWLKSWMPRSMTSRALVEPPIMLFGSRNHATALARNGQSGPRPIPRNSQWQISVVQVQKGSVFFLPYFAVTLFRLHFRVGVRWDHTDHYFTLDSLALKFRKPEHMD